MPRQTRLDGPDALRHIMVQGLDKTDFFKIHFDPICAGIVKTIEELDRCTIIGKTKHPWVDSESVLSQFGNTRRKALHEYRRFMQEGTGQGTISELTGGGFVRSRGGWSQAQAMRRRGQEEDFDRRILGGGEFINQILILTGSCM